MSNVVDKSFIHRSYPQLAYGSIYLYVDCDMLATIHLNSLSFFAQIKKILQCEFISAKSLFISWWVWMRSLLNTCCKERLLKIWVPHIITWWRHGGIFWRRLSHLGSTFPGSELHPRLRWCRKAQARPELELQTRMDPSRLKPSPCRRGDQDQLTGTKKIKF